MKNIDTFDFKNKKVIIRVDFNVPLNDNLEITDDTRIRAAIPTIKKIISSGGAVILMSHLGRPKNGPEDKFSLKHIVGELSKQLDTSVLFADDFVWATIKLVAGIKGIQDDPQKHLIDSKQVQDYVTNTKGVRLFFDGEWYINRNFNLKLRPEWIDIIKE
jgi:hypothetical protein